MSTASLAVRPRSVDASPEAHPGIRWWNSLPESERKDWLKLANSAVPADAWKLRNQLMTGIHGRDAA
ncbi:hypothetical protein [Thioalkalivibrio paradoxus]|uniref:hypothetical protein n=1 Tax=Thioalkalivibrio paradoxus TaxID=108010 RepID=UPI00022C3179|nr:hypothetical protein [Thioalkalivibrio paradoxus]